MSTQQGGGLFEGLKVMAGAVGTLLVVLFVVAVFTTGPLFAGIFGGLDQAVAWLVLLSIVAYVGSQTDAFGVGFTFTAVAILLVANQFLPGWLTQPFAFITEGLLDLQLSSLNETRMAVLLFATVIVYWAYIERVSGRGKRPGALAGRIQSNFRTLANQYGKIGRMAVLTVVAVAVIFLGQFGELLGEFARFAGNVPVISGYLATLIGGFGTFIADWPVIGDLDAMVFWGAAGVVFLAAVAVKYNE